MTILSIGTDPKIFDPTSSSAERMRGYGSAMGRYDIIARAEHGQKDFDLAQNVRVYAAHAPLPALFLFSALLAVYRAHRRSHFDLVTAENPFDVGLAAWIVARLFGAAFHLQVHGDFYGSREWRNERWSNRVRLWIARFLARRADGFRVVSERIKKSLAALDIAPERIMVSPIMEDTRALSRACMGIKKSSHSLILFVGRFEKEKNPLLLVQAFAEVKRQIPDAHLRLVGEGALRPAIEQKIGALGIASFVEILSWTSDLAPHYGAAHVLAIPSNHEGWGRVAVEAAACTVPVVMTDVGCAGEFVKNGESGWVVPVRNSSRLTDALVAALKDPQEAHRRAVALSSAAQEFGGAENALSRLALSWQNAREHFLRVTRGALRDIWRLLALAVIARAVMYALFVWRFGVHGPWGWFTLGSDDAQYLTLGQNLWHGVFSLSPAPPLLPDSSRTPVYPVFLMMRRFLPSYAVIALQQLFALAGIALWYKTARQHFSRSLSWWSALLFATDPVMLFWANQFTTEAVFSLFWFGALYCIARLCDRPRTRDAILCGILLGIAMLARPIVLAYPLIVAAFLAAHLWRARRKAFAILLALTLAIAAIVSPWILRNREIFGVSTLSSTGAGIQFGENAPTYLMWKMHLTREQAGEMLAARLPRRDLGPPYLDLAKMAVVNDLVRHDPFGFAYVMGLSAIPFFFGDGYASMIQTLFPSVHPPALRWDGSVIAYLVRYAKELKNIGPWSTLFVLGKALSFVTMAFALVGAAALLRNRTYRAATFWLMMTALYFAAVSGTIAYSRYRFPIEPILYLFAVAGIRAIARKKHANDFFA